MSRWRHPVSPRAMRCYTSSCHLDSDTGGRSARMAMTRMSSDIEIARAASLLPIGEVASRLGIPGEALYQYGPDKAKIGFGFLERLGDRPDGKLVLVTAITPTPAGEGKTTTTVGLGDGLNRIGKRAAICLREPSLGPCFGMKGGAAGGGYAQVVPMEDINLHFTGDFHAIGSAHNLLAALIDNHLYWGNELGIDARRITWRRVMDMNDRALRQIVSSLGGVANGYPREDGFDITVASEVMAIFCLAQDLARPRAPARRHHRRLHPRPAPGHRGRPQGRRADGGPAQGRADAEPGADAREQPRLRPRRPVRQHRPWLQLRDRDQGRAQARRLRGHRGGLRRRSRRGEVLRHQMPQGGPHPRRRGGRGDRARAQDARRRRRATSSARRTSTRSGAAWRTSPAMSRTSAASACRPWSRSTTSPATRPPSTRWSRSSAAPRASRRSSAATGPTAAPAPSAWPSTSSPCPRAGTGWTASASSCSTPTTCRSGTR